MRRKFTSLFIELGLFYYKGVSLLRIGNTWNFVFLTQNNFSKKKENNLVRLFMLVLK